MNSIKECQPELNEEHVVSREATKIVLVGCGHLGRALLTRWREHDLRCKVVSSRGEDLARQFAGVEFFPSLEELPELEPGSIVVLALPSQVLVAELRKLAVDASSQLLFVSMAAGVTMATLSRDLPPETSIARVMPNLSALIGESVTAAWYNPYVDEQQQDELAAIFQLLGTYFVLPQESQLDVITPLIGSGPSYVFLLSEALEASAEALGIDKERANQMVRLMLKGSADYLCQHNDKRAAQLREAVTSKAGVTAAVMDTLRPRFEQLIYQGVCRGQQRCRELNHENSR